MSKPPKPRHTPRELRLMQQLEWLEEERDALRAKLDALEGRKPLRYEPSEKAPPVQRFFRVSSEGERRQAYEQLRDECERYERSPGGLLGLPQTYKKGTGWN